MIVIVPVAVVAITMTRVKPVSSIGHSHYNSLVFSRMPLLCTSQSQGRSLVNNNLDEARGRMVGGGYILRVNTRLAPYRSLESCTVYISLNQGLYFKFNLNFNDFGNHNPSSLPRPRDPNPVLVIFLCRRQARVPMYASQPTRPLIAAARQPKPPRHSRKLGSPVIHDSRLQGNDSLEIIRRRRVLERCPELPRLAVILADRKAQRCSRAPVLRLVVAGPVFGQVVHSLARSKGRLTRQLVHPARSSRNDPNCCWAAMSYMLAPTFGHSRWSPLG